MTFMTINNIFSIVDTFKENFSEKILAALLVLFFLSILRDLIKKNK